MISFNARRIQFVEVISSQKGYLADVAVSEQSEGTGVARALMKRAEGWARECGFRILALDVFALNTLARSFYQQLGYVEETLKLIKEL